jgi:hypothetical protein
MVDERFHPINDRKIQIEVLTYDTRACSPCWYMVEMVKRAVRSFPGKVEWKETAVRTKEGLERFGNSGVTHLPTIMIDGIPEFQSLIPSEHQLVEAIRRHIQG